MHELNHPVNVRGVGAPHVNVIVLNWNGKDDTLACIESLTKSNYEDFSITIIDNGSRDGSVEAVRALHPQLEILCTGRNLGYAGGNNVGLRARLLDGRAQYILVLNNDTQVDPSMLDVLVGTARNTPGAAVFGPSIFFRDEPTRIWFAGAFWKPELMRFDHLYYGQSYQGTDEPYDTDYVTGCALFMSVDTLRAVGLLDERFFLIYEEVEWCYRLRKLGGRCLVVPRARMWHSVSASFGGADSPMVHYFTARNELLWAERSLSFRERMRLLASSLVGILLPEAWYKHRPPVPLHKRIYWSLRSKSSWNQALYRDKVYLSRTAGFRDYFLRRFGNCPDSLRAPR